MKNDAEAQLIWEAYQPLSEDIMSVAPKLAPHKKQMGACKMWTRDALEELAKDYPEIEGIHPMVATRLDFGIGMDNHYWLSGELDGQVVILDGTAGQVYAGMAWVAGKKDPNSEDVAKYKKAAATLADGYFGTLEDAPSALKQIYTHETAKKTNRTCK